jgi:hypothetical protein
MRVLQTAAILALAVAPVAATAAPLFVRPSAPIVWPHGLGARHVVWRGGEGDHDFWRHRHRQEFVGPIGPVVGEAVEPEPETALSPFVIAAPVTVNVTLAPAGGPPPDWSDGPKLIEIGRSAPPHGRLPLIVYGD